MFRATNVQYHHTNTVYVLYMCVLKMFRAPTCSPSSSSSSDRKSSMSSPKPCGAAARSQWSDRRIYLSNISKICDCYLQYADLDFPNFGKSGISRKNAIRGGCHKKVKRCICRRGCVGTSLSEKVPAGPKVPARRHRSERSRYLLQIYRLRHAAYRPLSVLQKSLLRQQICQLVFRLLLCNRRQRRSGWEGHRAQRTYGQIKVQCSCSCSSCSCSCCLPRLR
jgi:hypothetical protein